MSPKSKGDGISFPKWVPTEAREEISNYYSVVFISGNPVREARYMLQRLATRPAMEKAWKALTRFYGISPGRLVTMTFATWLSAMRIRSIGTSRPENTAALEVDSLRNLAAQARAVAASLRDLDVTIRVEYGITDVTLKEIARIAAYFKSEVHLIDVAINFAALSRKAGARNAHEIAFVNRMCDLLTQTSGPRPYALVATLTNVAFNVPEEKEWNDNRIKKCYASRTKNK